MRKACYLVGIILIVRWTNANSSSDKLLSSIAATDSSPLANCWKPSLEAMPGLDPCQSMAQDDMLRKLISYEVTRCLKEDVKKSAFEPVQQVGEYCQHPNVKYNLDDCVRRMKTDELVAYQRSYLMLFRSCSDISAKEIGAREAKLKELEVFAFKKKAEFMEDRIKFMQEEQERLEKKTDHLVFEKEHLQTENNDLRYTVGEMYQKIVSSKEEYLKHKEAKQVRQLHLLHNKLW